MKHFIKKYGVLLMLVVIFISCQKETMEAPSPTNGEKMDITFSITTGDHTTRAINIADENYIETIDVLVFKEEYFVERAEGKDITSTGPGQNPTTLKEFNVTLTHDYATNNRLVIIANGRDELNSISLHGTMNAILNQLVFENSSSDGRWPARLDGRLEFRPIPMWGQSEIIRIDGNLEAYLSRNPIQLYRALARVDLQIDNAVSNFRLTELYFYKYNLKGCIAPGKGADWADYPYDTSSKPQQRVRNVTVPQGIQPVKDFLKYDATTNNLMNTIYVLEVDRATRDDYQDASCLIVGGYYDRDLQPTYYRIDFEIIWRIRQGNVSSGITEKVIVEAGITGAGTNRTFARILRNHTYDITITKVSGPGSVTPQEALEQTKARLEVKAATWTNRNLNIRFE